MLHSSAFFLTTWPDSSLQQQPPSRRAEAGDQAERNRRRKALHQPGALEAAEEPQHQRRNEQRDGVERCRAAQDRRQRQVLGHMPAGPGEDRKSTRLNSSHVKISYAVFCLKKKIKLNYMTT